MQITLEQVHDIVNSNDNNQITRIASFSEVKHSYSYTASQRSYHITLSSPGRSYLLLVSPLVAGDPQPGTVTPSGPITLPALSVLLSRILDNTAMPIPRPVAHDVSGGNGKWPFGWLLLRIPNFSPTTASTTASLASVRHALSPTQLARIELRLGTHLRALHGITNDWFGMPVDKTPEPPGIPSLAALLTAGQAGEEADGEGVDMSSYSWQDTFVLQLEQLLERVCDDAETRQRVPCEIDIDQLRRSLSRAIGSFLFDDVEIPRLIWVTGNEEDVVVSLADDNGESDIAYMLPTFGHALWGDPLMETWFLPPGPSAAISEGYFDGEDGTLIVFPRHKTKRTWYTVYLALLILAEETRMGEGITIESETVRWARRILPECVEILKNAPCY